MKSVVVLCCVALAGMVLPVAAPAQASDGCPDAEWSEWYPVYEGLHIKFKSCWRGNTPEFEWNWSNFSNAGVSLAYRIYTRDVNNCTAPAHEAIGSGPLSVPAHTRLDVPAGGSGQPGRYGRVLLCISNDWQFAMQRAFDSLEVGSRLRLSRTAGPTTPLVGVVNEILPNAVRLHVPSNPTNSEDSIRLVRFDEISELAISRGIKNRAVFGLTAGGFVGSLGGALLGLATSNYECEYMPIFDDTINRYSMTRVCTGGLPGPMAIVYGLVSGAVGGVIGYLIGSKVHRESWATAGPTWTLVRFR